MKYFVLTQWLRLLAFGMISLCLFSNELPAAKLDPAGWKFVFGRGKETSELSSAMRILTDNNLSTCLTNLEIGIDFGTTNTIDRVYLTGTNRQLQSWPDFPDAAKIPPLGLVTVSVGNAWPPTRQVGTFTVPYGAGNPVDTEVDIRFNPVAGRYILIRLQTNVTWGVNYWPGYELDSQPASPANLTWRVAELEIHGFPGTFPRGDAVVLEADAPAPLSLAANDLSYYIGELSGKPVPVVTPRAAKRYPGTLYCVDDLKPLAPDYDTMMSNIKAGRLPNDVNIQVSGRRVLFSAWPYRCVLWSVWEFLERQGVRWVYPDAQGDYVPFGRGIDLSVLPLHYTPSATSIYANWNASGLQPWPPWDLQSVRQSYLYPWRNRWNVCWNGYGPLGGSEIPAAPAPGNLSAEYREKFDGYPHNFGAVVPERILLAKGPAWWGYDASLGRRVRPSDQITFCMDNPDLIQWVADKVVAVDAAYPVASQRPLNLFHAGATYNLLPTDGIRFCQDTQWCGPANGPAVPVGGAWVAASKLSMSGEYFHFVNSVADAVRARGSKAMIGALAYSDVFEPPMNIDKFPDNVQVEVCMYGAPNLPMASPKNADLEATWDAWHSKCSHLATYDYTLLHTDYWQKDPRLPVPLVTAIVDHAKYLARIGALNGGCQATVESLPYNPWNFYAYPRIRWNTNQTAQAILKEFFTGYFGEAAAPMLDYYRSYEDYEIANDVNLHFMGYCYGITPGSFPWILLYRMETSLKAAEKAATNWTVISRVGEVRAGFNWVVLEQRGLDPSDLVSLPICPRVPTNGAIAIDLARMEAPKPAKTSPSGNFATFSDGIWSFYAQGTIQTTMSFEHAGAYQVMVRARAKPFQNEFPILNCYLGSSGGSATITSTNFADYVFNVAISPAVWNLLLNYWRGIDAREKEISDLTWDLVLNYRNSASGGARGVFINQIQIKAEPSPAREHAATPTENGGFSGIQ